MATRKHKLTDAQRAVLNNLAQGKRWDSHISGMSAYGGALATLRVLRRQGYMADSQITEAGRVALRPTQVTKS